MLINFHYNFTEKNIFPFFFIHSLLSVARLFFKLFSNRYLFVYHYDMICSGEVKA